MKIAIAALVVATVLGIPTELPASPPGDECVVVPSLVAEIEHATDGQRTPHFVGDHVWFGESIYLPDGTFVGPAPTGTPRGEVPQFTDHILNTRTVTWGVVVDTDPGAGVYAPDGKALFDLPIEIHAEAVYAEDLILIADWGEVPSHLERVLLAKQDGTVRELTSAANGFGQFGTVSNETVYVVLRDGGIATFDADGNPGSVLAPTVQFSGITSANGYVYATEGTPVGAVGAGTVLHVFDGSGVVVNRIDLAGSAVRMGPTALGITADILGSDNNRAVAIAPNGAGLTELEGLHDVSAPRDSLAWHQGRYLIGIDAQSETPLGVITAQIKRCRLDGVALGTSASFEYRNWPASRPAGTVLALVGVDGESVEFRSLSGTLLGTVDYSLEPNSDIEAIDGNDEDVWVTTENPGPADQFTAHIYDLGECAGTPRPGRFLDDDWSIFENDIEWLAAQAITLGCNPNETNTRFCPEESLTRGEMAALLHRALVDSVSVTGPPIAFTDTSLSVFADDIDWLSATGITGGCGPATFCPEEFVTRGQIAAFLTRALDLPRVSDPGRFVDDDNSVFENDITTLAAAGITTGCASDRFCPADAVTRAEVAAFLKRSLGP